MNDCFKYVLVVALSSLCFGCDRQPVNNSQNGVNQHVDGALWHDSGLLDAQLDALEQARETEKSMSDAVDAREKKMRERGI